MDEQIFLNFRGKEDSTVFLFCFNCIFFLLLVLLVFLQLTERCLQFLLRGQRNDNYIHSFCVLKYQGKDYLSKSIQSRRVFFLTKKIKQQMMPSVTGICTVNSLFSSLYPLFSPHSPPPLLFVFLSRANNAWKGRPH